MRILHIIAGAEKGGAETFCLDAIKALHDGGVQQHVLCRPHRDFVAALDARGIKHENLSFNRFVKWFEQKKIRAAVASYKPDLVHCWMNRASSWMPAGVDVPTLGWFGGYYDLKNYRHCDFFMGVTKDIVRHIIDSTGKPHRAFLGHTFGTLEESPPVTRADFDVPDDAKTVLLLSRMHWKKGVDTLLQAAQSLENTYFLLAGDGPDIEKYRAMSAKMGLSDRVRFLGWRNDRAALLKIADVCVLPSRYEPFGTVIAEAWYARVPLVATKAAGAKQYVTHEHDGMLCDIDDAAMLARHIQAVANNNVLREKLMHNGRATYDALFSRHVVTQRLRQSYERMLQIGKSRSRFVPADGKPVAESRLAVAITALLIETHGMIDERAVAAVQNAYAREYDEDTARDAAYIQARGLYNFLKAGQVEILLRPEIENIIENEACASPKPHYDLFMRVLAGSAGLNRAAGG